jgi:rhamnulokinase
MLNVLAVDLGASSLRVAAVDLDARPLAPRIIHRYEHSPVRHDDGSLRWDWARLVAEVKRGLEVGLTDGRVASIGIDAWGVDYGLLDGDGELLSPPYAYRDARTEGWRTVVERIGAERLYATTGIQLMQINTIFQLAAHDRGELARAKRLLLLPELMVHALTGATMGERTSAGTTALVDLTTGDWSGELLEAIDVDRSILPRIVPATTYAGTYKGVRVHLVGGHDTASAIAALPSHKPNTRAGNPIFISSGTWMLVGTERGGPDTSAAAMRANFSNEPGVFGNVRFLKNVMGLWMLEQCREQWGGPPLEELLAAAAALPGGPTVDATDARFLAPADMEAEVRAAASLLSSAGRAEVARCVLDSLAATSGAVVRELRSFLGADISEIVILGGGSKNALLNRLIEEAAEVPIRTGPVEATLLGNALVQGIALGRFESLAQARQFVD